MRGDIVFRVYGLHEGREKDSFFGAFSTKKQAEAEIAKLRAREMNGRNWADQYHNRGFAIRKAVVETDFEFPSLPKPRDRYAVTWTSKPNRPGTWDSTVVTVHARTAAGLERICEYERNYSLFRTFEPFRQGARVFALVSRDYTKTAVLDLASGEIIAEELDAPGSEPGEGFCPVGFYVPDWWDLHDASIIPGSEYWSVDYEWPSGDFGFVWGCRWGDDSSLKVQYLDLSEIQKGAIRRDDRFGYVELATHGFESPCFDAEKEPADSKPPHFIRPTKYGGETKVEFAVEMQFDLDSGKPREWVRKRIENFE